MVSARVSTNNFATARFIVDTNGLQTGATHTTIAAAIADAVSGQTIFIRPGTYTENLTLKAGVALTAFMGDSITPTVNIVGTCTFNVAGATTINNIRLVTNSSFLIVVSGSAALVLTLNNCILACTNNTGISFTNSNANTIINIFNCLGNLDTTGISFLSSSSVGSIGFFNSNFTNSGGSTTATTASAGGISCSYSTFSSPISSTSTASLNMYYSRVATASQNAVSATFNGSGVSGAIVCQFDSGTAASISIGGGNVVVDRCSVTSSNANPVTGAGTLKYTPINFIDTGKGVNTTTRTPLNFGSFTPTLTGATTAGVTTYTTQFGQFTIVGNIVFIEGQIIITAATGTGNTIIGSFPFTIKNIANYLAVGTVQCASAAWGWPAGNTTMILLGNTNTTNAVISTTGTNAANSLQVTNGAATFRFSMWYQI